MRFRNQAHFWNQSVIKMFQRAKKQFFLICEILIFIANVVDNSLEFFSLNTQRIWVVIFIINNFELIKISDFSLTLFIHGQNLSLLINKNFDTRIDAIDLINLFSKSIKQHRLVKFKPFPSSVASLILISILIYIFSILVDIFQFFSAHVGCALQVVDFQVLFDVCPPIVLKGTQYILHR